MHDVLAVGLGYLLGSIPFAHLLARRRGIDLRRVGSGNVGATNALRVSGVPAGIAVMCLDAMKGSLAVLLAQRLAGSPAAVAAGLASVVGHIYPAWLGFRGGKGVATAAGVFGVLAPIALAGGAVIFIAVAWVTRYVSAGSLAGTATLVIVAVAGGAPGPVAAGAAVAAALIGYQHRDNVVRLFAGTERRIGDRVR